MDPEESSKSEPRTAARQLAIGFVIFCVVVVAMLVAVWVIGDQGNLPFDYQGFD